MTEITQILQAISQGDPHAADQLLPLVYEELRQLAAHKLAGETPGQTLQPTALVHEAYLRLVELPARASSDPGSAKRGAPESQTAEAQQSHPEQVWNSRGHFFGAAAEAMRRILVEAARRKQAVKHGGGKDRVPLQEFHRVTESPEDLLDLDEVLSRFALQEPAKAELVKLRFFAGLSTPEAAAALGISVPTAERWWAFARTWLFIELEGREKNPAQA